jgi:hypothetical protein
VIRDPLAKADWSPIPDHLRVSLKRYVNEGRVPGDFLVGILSNDLKMAVDSSNGELFSQVPAITAFINLYLPEHCYGSDERVTFWEYMCGIQGLAEFGSIWGEPS